jgi:hypothetical protein
MAEQTTRAPYEPQGETWASGFAQFGAVMLIVVGAFQAAQGLVAIIRKEFYVATSNYLFQLDLTSWGWVHLVLGAVMVLAGCGVLARQTWAVITGIVLCVLSAFANFTFIPYYPIWSLVIIALDVLVIWALLRYRSEASARA